MYKYTASITTNWFSVAPHVIHFEAKDDDEAFKTGRRLATEFMRSVEKMIPIAVSMSKEIVSVKNKHGKSPGEGDLDLWLK
jgi:hypothetical protein